MQLADLAPEILGLSAEVRRIPIAGVTADSRAVAPGYLFAALPGAKVDGARFIADAVKAGAAAVLIGGEGEAPAGIGVPVLRDPDPRRRFAKMVARLYAPQPKTVVAVTGTNGKTSVASFTRQIWLANGREAASVGTVGVTTREGTRPGNLTTPDPVALHQTLAGLVEEGIESVALEASSHGLDQRRLDGLGIAAGAFTNITHDHLDYHKSAEAYLAAKLRLFEVLLQPGTTAVVNADDRAADMVAAAARINGLDLFTVGRAGRALRLLSAEREGLAQRLVVEASGRRHTVLLPLAGAFQASNALVAAGLAIATGVPVDDALAALAGLVGASGRLEKVGETAAGCPVFVDYAHTPDALETVLETLRPYATGRLVVVFGCGGDRDRAKRPLMGAIAARLADLVFVTDDNPRGEEPAAIRAEIMAAAPGAIEIGDRAEAIAAALAELQPGDILLVAGKGHETGQKIGDVVKPFSDQEAVRAALALPADDGSLWTRAELAAATGAEVAAGATVTGVSIDSRSLAGGDLFIAIEGERVDGHDYVDAALERGAPYAVVAEARAARWQSASDRIIALPDTLRAMEHLAAAARERSRAKVVAVTGSVGKTSTKEALRLALGACGRTHASAASHNNHWGVPLTLSRLPRDAMFAAVEIGMNHAGEITPLTRLARPHIAIITKIAPVHLEHLGSVEAIARAKAEIFEGVEPGGTAVLPRDDDFFPLLAELAAARNLGVVGFGSHEQAEARATNIVMREDCSCVTATILGEDVTYKIGAAGRHFADNSLAVLAAARLAGADLARAALALAGMEAPDGRGRRHVLQLKNGKATLIDESYNANPASMRAALAVLAAAPTGKRGRRIAVLGDMLELGPEAEALHADLAGAIAEANVGRTYLAGPLMRSLHEALPESVRAGYAETSAGLVEALAGALQPGDAVMVKGSFGSRMTAIVKALLDRFGAPAAPAG